MNRTLNNYIDRANEIQNNKIRCLRNNIKITRQSDKNELVFMIQNLEKTMAVLKRVYTALHKLDEANEIDVAEQSAIKPTKSIIKSAVAINYKVAASQLNIYPGVIYWMPEINQYMTCINNIVLYGNIGNIFSKKLLLNNRIKAHQVVECADGNNCKNIIASKYCKFWHDPKQLLVLKENNIISDEYYIKTAALVRNFTNTSWMYSDDKLSTNGNMRYIGARSTLQRDVIQCNMAGIYKMQINNIKAQVMHDLLLLALLGENGAV